MGIKCLIITGKSSTTHSYNHYIINYLQRNNGYNTDLINVAEVLIEPFYSFTIMNKTGKKKSKKYRQTV